MSCDSDLIDNGKIIEASVISVYAVRSGRRARNAALTGLSLLSGKNTGVFGMKKGIHPDYKLTKITCVCGNVIETRSTVQDIHVEICSACHPFYTGKQKLVDTAGRIDRFNKRYGMKTDAAKPAEGK